MSETAIAERTEPMNEIEIARKGDLVGTVRKGLETFLDVGKALFALREERLYRDEFSTFEEFTQATFGFTKSRANQLIKAAGVQENLVATIVATEQNGTGKPVLPAHESQARELAKLPKEKQAKAWQKAVKAADGEQPTAEQVAEIVEKIQPPEEKEEPPKWKPKKDKYGTPIPKSLEESFASDEQFKQALDLHLPACGKAILELGRAKILKSQVVEVCRNSLAMVATKLKQARPYRVCKDCEGAGCKKCGQHGYFTQPTN